MLLGEGMPRGCKASPLHHLVEPFIYSGCVCSKSTARFHLQVVAPLRGSAAAESPGRTLFRTASASARARLGVTRIEKYHMK